MPGEKTAMTDDLRKFSRISFNTPARLQVAGGEPLVEVIDISLKGALVRPVGDLVLAIGSPAVLNVRLDDGETLIRMVATVVHHEAGRYGLVCTEIDLDSVTHLRRLVELNLGDETLLERELAILSSH